MADEKVVEGVGDAASPDPEGAGRLKETYIRFMAPVIPPTTDRLFRIVDAAIKDRCDRLHLMLSSPGGSVFHGLSTYNFLRGAPIEVYTYNFGSVDSIGVVIYCAGTRRFSVPHARFLLHGVRFNVQANVALDEKQVGEHLKSLQIDEENIARVISDNTNKALHEVKKDMHERTTLNPQEARDYGLTHEIKSELFPIDAQLAVVREIPDGPAPAPARATGPVHEAFTRFHDLDVGTL